MKVIVAKHAGVCYGVQRALDLAQDAVEKSAVGRVYSLGPLIHNPQAVEQLHQSGVEVADTLDNAAQGDTLIIRSHGVAPEVIAEAKERNLTVVDATCPHVSKAQEAARLLALEGYLVIIVGEADHPEVAGIKAYAGQNALVVSSAAELPEHIRGRRIGVVVQTTQVVESLNEVVAALVPRTNELRVYNTICNATSQRQQAARELASTVDVVIVVGGHNSGNTTRLAEICHEQNARTYHVETAQELNPAWFADADTVGVTAGASTPDEQMRGVIQIIEEMDE